MGTLIGDYLAANPYKAPQPQAAKKKKPSLLESLLPTIGGVGGGVGGGALGGALAGSAILPGVGTAAGGLLGALLGGAAGGAAGKAAENNATGQSLGNGVAGQALEQGVLSAGPLRLLRGARAATTAVKAGSGLAEAANAGGQAAAAPGVLRTLAADKLNSTADSLAQRGLKMNGSKFNTDFAARTGEEVGQYARRFGVPANGVQGTINKILNPGFTAHAAAVQSIGDIPKADVLANIKAQVASEAASKVPASQQFAKSVVEGANGILKNFGKTIPATELNSVKTEIAAQVNHAATDTASRTQNEVLNRVSSGFRGAINQAADTRGIQVNSQLAKLGFKSKSVGDLGEELHNLDDFLGQANVKSRVGVGSAPISLSSLPGVGAGASAGGVPGAIAGGIISQGIDSTGGRRVLGTAADQLATKATTGGNPFGISAITRRSAPIGLAGALMNTAQRGGASNDMTSANAGRNNSDSNSANISPLSQNNQDMSSTNQTESPYSVDALNADVARDPAHASAYFDLFNNYQKATADSNSGGKTFNSAIAGHISDVQNGLNTLEQLKQLVQSPDYSGGVVEGRLRSLNPFDNTYRSQQAVVDASRQIVGKALEGGVLRKEDEAKYVKILPTLQDSQEVALNKLNYIQTVIQQGLQQYQGLVGDGGGQDDLTSALMQAGYGQ